MFHEMFLIFNFLLGAGNLVSVKVLVFEEQQQGCQNLRKRGGNKGIL